MRGKSVPKEIELHLNFNGYLYAAETGPQVGYNWMNQIA